MDYFSRTLKICPSVLDFTSDVERPIEMQSRSSGIQGLRRTSLKCTDAKLQKIVIAAWVVQTSAFFLWLIG